MKRVLILAAMTAATLATPAHAYTDVTCVASLLTVACAGRATNPSARIITMPEYHDPDLTDAERASWASRCKPRRVFDGLAVRWVYAERGCSAGPIHGVEPQ